MSAWQRCRQHLCVRFLWNKYLYLIHIDSFVTMVVGVDVRSEQSSLLIGRARFRAQSKASRILVPVVLSVFAVALLAISYSVTLSSPNVQLAETSNVGEQVLQAITHVSSKSGKLHSEAKKLQETDQIIRQTLARDRVDASADEHGVHKYSQDLAATKPLLAANQAIVARLQARIKAADTELATAKIAMVAAQAAEAAGKQSYLKAAAPWQKVQSQEAVAQKKYRADVQRLNKALKATAKDPHDSFAQDRVTDVEKRLHEDRKASRSDTIDLDNLGVLAGQQKLVQTVRKAEETLAAATSKFSDIMSKKGTASSRLEAELHKVADEKARIAADQRMLAHFKDLLATIDAQEGRETKHKLDVMSRINELVASAPVVVTAAAKPSVAKK